MTIYKHPNKSPHLCPRLSAPGCRPRQCRRCTAHRSPAATAGGWASLPGQEENRPQCQGRKPKSGWWFFATNPSEIWWLYGLIWCKIPLMIILSYLAGWWLSPTPLKNHGVKVSWDDDIPNWMESHKIHVRTHQPEIHTHTHQHMVYLWFRCDSVCVRYISAIYMF